MNQITKTILLALNLVCSANASAAEWEKITTSDDSTHYVDREGVVRKGSHVRSWTKVTFDGPQTYKGGQSNGTKYGSMLQYADIDCDTREMYIVSALYYVGADGEGKVAVAERPTPGEQPNFSPIVPGSVGEVWMKYVCNPKTGK